MDCPKCGAEMQTIMYGSIYVERCVGCKGLWFDMLEREHMAAIEGSEIIDIGSDELGHRCIWYLVVISAETESVYCMLRALCSITQGIVTAGGT